MSIIVRFTGAPSLTPERYDATQAALEASPHFPPDGLAVHVAFQGADGFTVVDIWDSQEQFEAFGQHLMPILEAHGVELAGQPVVREVHNLVQR
jgi:hypothetical protein